MDIQNYWRQVRRIEASLPAGSNVWITSIENPTLESRGGVTVECDRLQSAKHIFGGSHRLATPPEIEASRLDEARRVQESEADVRMRRSENRLQLSPQMIAAITSRRRQ